MRLEEIFVTLLNMSITAGFVVVVVALLRLLLRKAPRWISRALWALVGLRLVLPFSLESIISLIPSSNTVTPDILYSSAPAIHSGFPTLNSTVNPVISGSLAPTAGAAVSPMQTVMQLASIVWVAGMAVLALYSLVSYMTLRRRVASAVLLRDNIFEADAVVSPFVLGIIKPRIYLPFGVADGDKAYILAHERAHIRRKDHWIKPLGFLLLTVYWFNPLIWAAYTLLCRDIELACDEAVIKDIGDGEKKAYSTALIDCAVSRRRIALCPLAFGEVGLKARVKNVLNYRKPAFWVILVAVAASIVAAVCLLTNPKTSGASYVNPKTAQLFENRAPSVNARLDMTKVGQQMRLLDFPTGAAAYMATAGLQAEHYDFYVDFKVTPEVKAACSHSDSEPIESYRVNACILLSLMENTDLIVFRLDDDTGDPLDLKFTRDWAKSVVGADLWSESSSPARLDRLLTRIKEHVKSAYASATAAAPVTINTDAAVTGLPDGTFTPSAMVYLGPWFNVTPNGYLENNRERVFTISGGTFRDGDKEMDTRFQAIDMGNSIQTMDTSGVFDIDVSGYHEKAGWSVLNADGQDTGYRIFRLDGQLWIGQWGWYGSKHDAWWCTYIFKVSNALKNGAGVGSNTVHGKDVTPDVTVGKAATGASLPSTANLPRGYKADASDDGTLYRYENDCLITEGYIGWINKPVGWLVLKQGLSLGSEDAYVYLTRDGGISWTEIGNANSLHRMGVTGAGFPTEQVGFISYRYYVDAGPDIWRTTDGGSTWARLAVTLPKEYQADNYRFTPLSPRFNGQEGVYPIQVYKWRADGNVDHEMISMVSHDGGLSWSFENSGTAGATIAPPSALSVRPSRDGVDSFLQLLGPQKPLMYDNDTCYNVTPDFVAVDKPFRIFKFSQSCASYLLYDGAVYPLGQYFGGSGVDSFALADLNGDGLHELYFTFSWGSGLHRSQIGYFDPAVKKVTVFETSILNSDCMLTTNAENQLCVSTARIDFASENGFVNFDIAAEAVKGYVLMKDGVIQYKEV